MRAMLLAVAAVVLSACATTRPAPVVRLANARGAIRAAEQLEADQYPSAANFIASARVQAAQGTRLIELGQFRRAAYVLERAEADAELALALAKEAPVREEARRALEQVREMQRRAPPQTETGVQP